MTLSLDYIINVSRNFYIIRRNVLHVRSSLPKRRLMYINEDLNAIHYVLCYLT